MSNENKITFMDAEHERFFFSALKRCNNFDVYHQSFFYLLGLNADTRRNAAEIYDFDERLVRPGCLEQGWQTSGTVRIVRLAFNLYCNGTPSVKCLEGNPLDECKRYAVDEIFCCSYAPYFWQAIKLRYPEYCGTA